MGVVSCLRLGAQFRGQGGPVLLFKDQAMRVRTADIRVNDGIREPYLALINKARGRDRYAIARLQLIEGRKVLTDPSLLGKVVSIKIGGQKRTFVLGLKDSPELKAAVERHLMGSNFYQVSEENIVLPSRVVRAEEILKVVSEQTNGEVSLLSRESLAAVMRRCKSDCLKQGIKATWIASTHQPKPGMFGNPAESYFDAYFIKDGFFREPYPGDGGAFESALIFEIKEAEQES